MYGGNYQETIHGAIAVHDGEKIVGAHFCKSSFMWDDYVDAYGIKDQMDLGKGKTLPVVVIPLAHAVLKKAMPLSCLFTATKTLAQNMWGTTLDEDDRGFFEDHPLASESGVGISDTLRVVQEIVDPYNLRISRVHLMPGTPINGDLLQWVNVLGVNPLALGDMQTSNAMFAQMMGKSVEEMNKQYRMQYTEEKIRPAILCAHAPMRADSKDGVNLGHAEYAGAGANRAATEPAMQV